MKITHITSEEILDSRGNPTLLTTVVLEDGNRGHAAVPSGASKGIHEAHELRDNDPKRYNGLGVLQAIHHVKTDIAHALLGMDAGDQIQIDQVMKELDGTDSKSHFGANAILSVSLAVARAEASAEKKELYEYLAKFSTSFSGKYILPLPQMNILNGGKHANWATDIQEYIILPVIAATIQERVRIGSEVYHHLYQILKDKKYTTTVGDEGGFAPLVQSNEEPFHLLQQAVENAGFMPGKEVVFGIDAAASEFFTDGSYHLSKENKTLSADELGALYQDLMQKYPIISFEDIFEQDDFDAFAKFHEKVGEKIQVTGDDLYATNPQRLKKGIEAKASNAILVKLNQIGTLSETIEVINMAHKHNIQTVVSHRSGETDDAFIADLAVAMGSTQIKIGALARGERIAKYNRLMTIERHLGEKAQSAVIPFSTQAT